MALGLRDMDNDLIDFAVDKELAEIEASYEASLERVRPPREGILLRRRSELCANRGSSGWGDE
jgi:hypothetical protein